MLLRLVPTFPVLALPYKVGTIDPLEKKNLSAMSIDIEEKRRMNEVG